MNDAATRNELALTAYRLAIRIAIDYRSNVPLHLDDRISAAVAGLMTAASRFDASKGAPFVAWAAAHIRWSLDEAFLSIAPVKVPQWITKKTLGLEQLSARTREAAFAALSTSPPLDGLPEIAGDDLTPLDALLFEESISQLRESVRRLPRVERYVIERRFGLDGRDPETFPAIAQALGLCAGACHRIQARALRRLRTYLEPATEAA